MVDCDAHDNSFMLLDFGNALVGVVYGAAAGNVNSGLMPSFFGTKGAIVGLKLNGEPFDYPGREGAEAHANGVEVVLPHVTGVHREIEEQHVFEDVMQLVDWVRAGTPSIATAEHARHVIDIIESAYRAARTGQTQQLSTTF
jgi:predicted dehydrogenase